MLAAHTRRHLHTRELATTRIASPNDSYLNVLAPTPLARKTSDHEINGSAHRPPATPRTIDNAHSDA